CICSVFQIIREEENAEKANEQAREEIQARKGVLLPPQESNEGAGKPRADRNMLNVYELLPFDDPDGGVWKQGWPVTYDTGEVPKQKKLEVVVTPHSHTDPGWIKTFEAYYHDQTKNILDAMLTYLLMFKDMRFVYAEISFFEQWWAGLDEEARENVKKLIKSGSLEILTGGWVMTDEANAHYFSMITQLIEGHEWIRNHLGEEYLPVNHWSIDPFGLSATLPYLIARANLSNAVVQRVHYSVKKYFAKEKKLEFKWRQMFSKDDLLTHMMPFFSYDVPHTCGPDPKICCQFDFRRLQGGGVTCPWNEAPVIISEENVAARAEMLYDQYRKKAQLFKTNVLFVPLGDDFRYDIDFEWKQQYSNYKKLFDYMNAKTEWNVHARFGTPNEYFKLMRERLREDNDRLPVLTGDFFTYSDRNDHYWSGNHFISIWTEQYSIFYNAFSSSGEIFSPLVVARRYASLFQHHDGVTGTAKSHVMTDYGEKLVFLSTIFQIFIVSVLFLVLGRYSFREIILFNSLAQERQEVVCVYVKSANSKVKRSSEPGVEVLQQISPVIEVEGNQAVVSREKFEVITFLLCINFTKLNKQWNTVDKHNYTNISFNILNRKLVSLEHSATVYFNTPYIQLENYVEIVENKNFEFAMRLKSDIQNGEYLATDLNGFQMVRRRRFSKLPLQAHFYPMPGTAFIEDNARRLSLLGAQANGVASLESGWLEVMLDRRLLQDDGRGLFSPVVDNKRTRSIFRLLLESLAEPEEGDKSPICFNSLPAHQYSLQLHYPVISFFANQDECNSPLPCDLHIVNLRTMAAPTVYGSESSRSYLASSSQALIVHRLGIDCRSKTDFRNSCPANSGKLKPLSLLVLPPKRVVETSLTLLYEKLNNNSNDEFDVMPMDIKTFKLDFS
ncbi:unnamed protein product, partial [Enterobius vermicularis]|uniref:Alpha-mann_mid domain-containing protein n=1 Tax=Enterobius vermicularis TaxID=51028 RepID=A0A0N4VAF4_ENTVE